jgi:hypothetical protein
VHSTPHARHDAISEGSARTEATLWLIEIRQS